MKKTILILLAILYVGLAFAQEEEKKKSKFKLKMPELKIGEKLGNLAGNLMTSTTKDLNTAVAKSSITSGLYPPEINTSEAKYFPKGTIEGDYMVAVTFMKGEGMGMYKIDGTVTCEGEEMEYVGLGSYLKTYRTPFKAAKTINIKTVTGDEASFSLKPIVGVEIVSVNGENSLPVLDLAEDIKLTYRNPIGSKGTRIRISLITDVAGARALNHFASFDARNDGEVTVTIPKESLSNPEIVGSIKGVGNFNKGENFLIVEREFITERDKMDASQRIGKLQTAEIKATSYAAMPVIIKGKQDESVYASIRVNQKESNGIGYTFYKPNANYGIPLSKGSKFGLASFTLEGKTYKTETEKSERYGYGNTRIITTTTTTYKFPQLPATQWQSVMEKVYTGLVKFMKTEYNIDFVPVDKITSNSNYAILYPAAIDNTEKIIKTSYKGTQRTDAKSLGEILGSVSSNFTSDNAMVNLMKEADVDGLVSMRLNFQVAGNSDGKVVLIPSLTINITGRDETNNNKQGTYASAYIVNTTGNPFNGDLIKTNPTALAKACSTDEMIKALTDGIRLLRTKEVALGYDKIWNIGQ
ncbi:hypothetical protein [Pedobacter alpinus]|uniref:Uncharacterized protein n=1 Tax=Pedobacter alpinus TaxID=1590643 RepID=A0ABW5TPN2_9SPHI